MIRLDKKQKFTDRRLFIIIFALTVTIFIFTTDGHRNTFDEDPISQQALRISTWSPHPDYIQGESRLYFEYERFKLNANSPVCINGILCSNASVMQSLTQLPFILINQNLNILTEETIFLSGEDFDDQHYVWWRNTLAPELIFMELLYGPVFSALSVGVLFLISRTFNFSQRTSITLAILYGFTTFTWAYSQSSLNIVPSTFFILLGFLYFRKFLSKNNYLHLILCSVILGVGFLIRQDVVIFALPIFLYLMLHLKKNRIKTAISYLTPLALCYGILRLITMVKFAPGTSKASAVVEGYAGGAAFQETAVVSELLLNVWRKTPVLSVLLDNPFHIGGFGLLFAPGVGLFVFCPILLLVFLSFPDFFKRNKPECILLIVFFGSFIYHYGTLETWHGLVAWGPRYLMPIIPFLILTIGATIEKRKNYGIKIPLIVLAVVGGIINILYIFQDVNWFIWSWPGHAGLFGIDKLVDGVRNALNLDPSVIWTFQYSQLTHAFLGLWNNDHDIFLLRVLSPVWYICGFVLSLSIILYSMVVRNLSVLKR